MPADPSKVREKLLGGISDLQGVVQRGRVPFDTLCRLLALDAPSNDNYEYRYLGRGRSQSEVLLLVQKPGRLRVIKCGPSAEILKEYDARTLSLQLERRFRAGDFECSQEVIDGFRSMSSSFAADTDDATTLASALIDRNYRAPDIEGILTDLIPPVFRWSDYQMRAATPIRFPWREQAGTAIRDTLSSFDAPLQKLVEVIDGTYKFQIGTLKTALGRCHGDLNVNNVLIGITPGYKPQPCLIDFTWAQEQCAPAHDWAKLERDIKLYVLRKSLRSDLETYNKLLELINHTALDSSLDYSGRPEDTDFKCITAIRTIRDTYLSEFKAYDQPSAMADYLYRSLCWNLAYLDTDEYATASTLEQAAIVLSAKQVFDEFLAFLRDRKAPGHPRDSGESTAAPTPARDLLGLTEASLKRSQSVRSFRSEARIAGYIDTPTGLRAIYLDELYIHRRKLEDGIEGAINAYLSKDSPLGLWVSIQGDAGHGKTSLLWQTLNILEAKDCKVYAIQAQQLSTPFSDLEALASEDVGLHPVIVIDTLDIIVGLNDSALAQALNNIRAQGALVISTSRRQELLTLAIHIRPDIPLDLPRYDIPEADAAINKWIALYVAWTSNLRDLQLHRVRNLLDQRRNVHELSFEPLILRMIFEAYYPQEIPDDINTQQIYSKFWSAKVLADRTVKSAEASRARGLLCGLLADLAVFGERHSDNVPVSLLVKTCGVHGIVDADSLIEDLVSSGALRYSRLGTSVGFFHQTFLEYSLAHHILADLAPSEQQSALSSLLESVNNNDLFKAPVVKQLLLQASGYAHRLFMELAVSLRQMETPLAARLLLEVAGKGVLSDSFVDLIRDWNRSDPELFHAVGIEVIRSYPSNRMSLGFELLGSMLDSANLGRVLFACQRIFAPFAAKDTFAFLKKAARISMGKSSTEISLLKSALLAVFAAGEIDALEFLFDLFPLMSPGVQAGALEELSVLITNHNDLAAAKILERAFNRFFEELATSHVDILFKLFRQIRQLTPSFEPPTYEASGLTNDPRRELAIVLMNARIRGAMDPPATDIEVAVRDLTNAHFEDRLAAAEFLWTAAPDHPEVLRAILSVPVEQFSDITFIRAAFRAASGADDPSGMKELLDRFPFPERGIGDSYRRVLEKLARSDSSGTAHWLREKMTSARTDGQIRQVMVAFQVLAETDIKSLNRDDVARIIDLGFSKKQTNHEIRRVFASGAGKIADIDAALANEIFKEIIRSGNREFIAAAINSLYTVDSAGFVVDVMELLLPYMLRKGWPNPLGLMLDTLSDSPIGIREAILNRLTMPDYLNFVAAISDSTVVSRLLQFARNSTPTQVQTAFTLASTCQITDRNNRPMYAAVLKNVCIYTADPALHYKALDGLIEVSTMHQGKVRNSLYSTLKRLDRVLPHRFAVEAVLKAIILDPTKWDKRALRDLITAAMQMPGWGIQDSRRLLEEGGLSDDIQAILHNPRN